MSYYNHAKESDEIGTECSKCGKKFTWSENGPFYPGGKDTEFINCPYCGETNGSIRTSGFVTTSKLEE